jgi:hypothetical protein
MLFFNIYSIADVLAQSVPTRANGVFSIYLAATCCIIVFLLALLRREKRRVHDLRMLATGIGYQFRPTAGTLRNWVYLRPSDYFTTIRPAVD